MTLFGANHTRSIGKTEIPRLALPRPKGAKCWGLGSFQGLDPDDPSGKIGEIFENDLNPDFEVNMKPFYSTDLPWQLALLWAGSSGRAKQQEVAGIQIESQSSC